jgi:hypothetical protein
MRGYSRSFTGGEMHAYHLGVEPEKTRPIILHDTAEYIEEHIPSLETVDGEDGFLYKHFADGVFRRWPYNDLSKVMPWDPHDAPSQVAIRIYG